MLNESKLNMKQKAFCDYYIASGNATEAAVKAGYSEKTAAVIASENLRKVNIKTYLSAKISEIENERTANIIEVQEFWAKTMRDKELKDTDRIKVSELIAKTHGAFIDKVESNTEVTILFEDSNKEYGK